MYVYHYHAIFYNPDGSIKHNDGILATNIQVDCWTRYCEIKVEIADKMGVDDGDSVIVQSLTKLR